jgi:dihydrofolate reductase
VKVSLIAAVAENGVIGNAGDLVWRLPADMRFFRQTTTGHHVVMGRKTWESIGKPLRDRTNVIITRKMDFDAPGCVVVHSLEEALSIARAAGETEAFVIGGSEIYAMALPIADRLYLTRIHESFDGDTVFPDIDAAHWVEANREEHEPDEKNAYRYAFTVLERRT